MLNATMHARSIPGARRCVIRKLKNCTLPLWLGAAGLIAACSPVPPGSPFVRGEMNENVPATTSDVASSASAPGASMPASSEATANESFLASVESWQFGPFDGKILVTQNYRVHTTLERESSLARVPVFVESALAHYRSALGELPAPPKPMSTYLFQTRDQWEAQMHQLLPSEAGAFHNLGRGGLTTQGKAILYYIDRRGMSDTLAITAHEGWHQYTQSTFKQALPVWLEEGVATYMEGYVTRSDGAPTFRPWENRERYGALRDSVRRDRMIPLNDILGKKPQEFLEDGRRSLLTYYAQVWAITHFLAVGEGGKYRDALEQVIADAAFGNLHRRLSNSTAFTIRSRRELHSDRLGTWIILEYFNRDMSEFQQEFDAFVSTIVEGRVLDRMHADLVFEEE